MIFLKVVFDPDFPVNITRGNQSRIQDIILVVNIRYIPDQNLSDNFKYLLKVFKKYNHYAKKKTI